MSRSRTSPAPAGEPQSSNRGFHGSKVISDNRAVIINEATTTPIDRSRQDSNKALKASGLPASESVSLDGYVLQVDMAEFSIMQLELRRAQ